MSYERFSAVLFRHHEETCSMTESCHVCIESINSLLKCIVIRPVRCKVCFIFILKFSFGLNESSGTIKTIDETSILLNIIHNIWLLLLADSPIPRVWVIVGSSLPFVV